MTDAEIVDYIAKHPHRTMAEIAAALGCTLDEIKPKIVYLAKTRQIFAMRMPEASFYTYIVLKRGEPAPPREEYKGGKLPYRYEPRSRAAMALPGFAWSDPAVVRVASVQEAAHE